MAQAAVDQHAGALIIYWRLATRTIRTLSGTTTEDVEMTHGSPLTRLSNCWKPIPLVFPIYRFGSD